MKRWHSRELSAPPSAQRAERRVGSAPAQIRSRHKGRKCKPWNLADLLGAAVEALGYHVDLVNRLCVIPHSGSGFKFLSVRPHGTPSHHVERLLVGSGKRGAYNSPRRRDQAKEF